MPKIKLDGPIYDRAKKAAEIAGYSGVDEFLLHLLEKELALIEQAESSDDDSVQERLRGLGYIE